MKDAGNHNELIENTEKLRILLQSSVRQVIDSMTIDVSVQGDPFGNFQNLPRWRSVFDSVEFNEKQKDMNRVYEYLRENGIGDFKAAIECVNFMEQCQNFKADYFPPTSEVFGRDEGRRAYFEKVVKDFIVYYVRLFGLQYDQEAFNEFFKAFQVNIPEFPRRVEMHVALLTGIEVENEELYNLEKFVLRPINPYDLDILEHAKGPSMNSYNYVRSSDKIWCIELRNVVEPFVAGGDGGEEGIYFPDDYVHPNEIFQDILTSLRLFGDGGIGVSYVLYYETTLWNSMSIGRLQSYSTRDMIFPKPNLVIHSEDSKELDKIWKTYNSTKDSVQKKYKVAINRFNKAREGRDYEEIIVDAMIALENLFPPETSAYIGNFLGKSLENVIGTRSHDMDVLETTKEAYFARNRVVHGEDIYSTELEIKGKSIKFNFLCQVMMNWLRRALLTVLSTSKTEGS